jgi:dihydrouridine synthase (Dus)
MHPEASIDAEAAPIASPTGAPPPGSPYRPIQIGSKLAVWPPVVLAPMAGVTSYPYRKICRDFGAGLCITEMVSSRALVEQH